MTSRIVRILAVLAFVGTLATGACTDQSGSPAGIEILPGGILEQGLSVVIVDEFLRAADFAIFPSSRAFFRGLTTAKEWPEAPGFESRAPFRFEIGTLDSLPDGTLFVESKVHLAYSTPEEPVELTLHRVTSAWEEEAATWFRRDFGEPWETAGGDFAAEPVARFTIGPDQPDSLEVPVPNELVAGWDAGEIPNHGLILVQQTPGERVSFVSGEAASGLGPQLRLGVLLPALIDTLALEGIRAEDDTFLVIDRSPPEDEGQLLVTGAEPPHRTFLRPSLDQVPTGSSVASARLVLTVASRRVPADSFPVVVVGAVSDFLGEKTVFSSPTLGQSLDFRFVGDSVQPGDTLIFQSSRLTQLLRVWIRDPESNRGIGVLASEEEFRFGGVGFFGPDAPPEVRPRFRLLVLPPQADTGEE